MTSLNQQIFACSQEIKRLEFFRVVVGMDSPEYGKLSEQLKAVHLKRVKLLRKLDAELGLPEDVK